MKGHFLVGVDGGLWEENVALQGRVETSRQSLKVRAEITCLPGWSGPKAPGLKLYEHISTIVAFVKFSLTKQ